MKLVTTKRFENGIKILRKKHLNDIIEDIEKTVKKLLNKEITTQQSNHKLTNYDINDIHIRPNVILLYRYDTDDSMIIELKLLDLTDHDNLNNSLNYIKKNKL